MTFLAKPAVIKVRVALKKSGLKDSVMELEQTAKTAVEAASALGCPVGAIIKSLVFVIDRRMVMALVAGDHRCIQDNLPAAFNIKGSVRKANAGEVKDITGFTIGGVSPVGLTNPLPIVIDRSLKRFDDLFAAGGHPHAVFPIAFNDLQRMTDGIVSWNIAKPDQDIPAKNAPLKRSATFLKGKIREK